MDKVNQLRVRLNAFKRRNIKLTQEMARMPETIGAIGRTPIVDVNKDTSGLDLVAFTSLHKHVGGYYGKIVKILLSEGIVSCHRKMWCLREDLQDAGLAVYVTGQLGCYYIYRLKWTPSGVEYIREIMNKYNK